MKVRALREGYLFNARIKEGSVFEYEQKLDDEGKPKPLPRWLEPADAPKAEKKSKELNLPGVKVKPGARAFGGGAKKDDVI